MMDGDTGRANLAAAAVFADELASRGLHHVVICPGSRSTPLAVALASHPGLKAWILVDERSASFFALGMARQIDGPVAILCTSRIPLIVLTADRPPELRDWGAAQTIDQIRLFGRHAKWFVDMPVPDESAPLRQVRATAARALQTAAAEPRGVVHLNFPFREPLLPVDLRPPLEIETLYQRNRSSFAGITSAGAEVVVDQIDAIAACIAAEPGGLIVCGPGESPGLPAAAAALAAATGYPLLADPLSGVRFGGHDRTAVVSAYDVFLRDPALTAELAPQLVIRTGAIPTSKPLLQFLAAHPDARHVVIDPGDPRDPAHLVTDHLRVDPAHALSAMADACTGARWLGSWREAWKRVDATARCALDRALDAIDEPFEGRALAEVAAALPDRATLVLGNSMPVRDADTFVSGDSRAIRIVANRGANGIDGVVSSALGAAAVADEPVVLVIGDLSFYHDMNGLLAARLYELDATIVVLNNDGGGIFSFLPQAEQLGDALFDALFGTPIGLDVAAAARQYGANFVQSCGWASFRAAVRAGISSSGLSIVELVTERRRNRELHRQTAAAVHAALRMPAAAP